MKTIKTVGWGWALALALCGMSGIGGAASVEVFSNPNSHDPYVLNEAGQLYRWGEPWTTLNTDLAVRFLYPTAPIAVPPPPDSDRWASVSGFRGNLFPSTEEGRLFLCLFVWNQGHRLLPLPHPDPERRWVRVQEAVLSSRVLIWDDANELYQLDLNVPVAAEGEGDWWNQTLNGVEAFSRVDRPAPVGHWRDAAGGFPNAILLGDEGEIYAPSDTTRFHGDQPTPVGSYARIARPDGVQRWNRIRATYTRALAEGDDGEWYIWGRTHIVDGQRKGLPMTIIPRPAGVTVWKEAWVSGGYLPSWGMTSTVFLLGDDGLIYLFDRSYPAHAAEYGLTAEYSPDPVRIDPAGDGRRWNTLRIGGDHGMARDEAGEWWRWGVLELDHLRGVGIRSPSPLPLPREIIDPVLAELPVLWSPQLGAKPGPLRVGEPVEVLAEAWAWEGTLEEVTFAGNPILEFGPVTNVGANYSVSVRASDAGRFVVTGRAVDSAGRVTTRDLVEVFTAPQMSWTLSNPRLIEPADGDDVNSTAELVIRRDSGLGEPLDFEFGIHTQVQWSQHPPPAELEVVGAEAVDAGGRFRVHFPVGEREIMVRLLARRTPAWSELKQLTVHSLNPGYVTADSGVFGPPASLSFTLEQRLPAEWADLVRIIDEGRTRYLVQGGALLVDYEIATELFEPWVPWTPHLVHAGTSNRTGGDYNLVTTANGLMHRRASIQSLPLGEHRLAVRARLADGTWIQSRPVNVVMLSTDEAGVVEMVGGTNVVSETASPQLLTIRRTGGLQKALTVGLQMEGTARPGADFVPLPTTVEFAVGESEVTVPFELIDDDQPERLEGVVVRVAPSECLNRDGCHFALSNGRAVVIEDDDPA
ncbi:MAG TPA: hypothetical protein DCY13_02580, partial [Verrucomicrobiales bacterium]|nr:hypothetical protein [Verrucomicrobiales bacterium]